MYGSTKCTNRFCSKNEFNCCNHNLESKESQWSFGGIIIIIDIGQVRIVYNFVLEAYYLPSFLLNELLISSVGEWKCDQLSLERIRMSGESPRPTKVFEGGKIAFMSHKWRIWNTCGLACVWRILWNNMEMYCRSELFRWPYIAYMYLYLTFVDFLQWTHTPIVQKTSTHLLL